MSTEPIPLGGLVRDSKGNLYGATAYGGGYENCYNYGCGTVFKVDTAGREIVLHRFTGGADGGNPSGGLPQDAQGNLYGTTAYGGFSTNCQNGCGIVFKLTP